MAETCFKLRNFNLPQAVMEVLKKTANANGDICESKEPFGTLQYSGVFSDLSVENYLKLQSDFASKGLISRLHSPDDVRFAKEGLADYISDPQKRRAFVSALEMHVRYSEDMSYHSLDSMKCSWDKNFWFTTWRSDDVLINAVFEKGLSEGCSQQAPALSLAHYYGLSDAQIDHFVQSNKKYADIDLNDLPILVDALMRCGRSYDDAVTLMDKIKDIYSSNRLYDRPNNWHDFIVSIAGAVGLSRYGVSDVDILKLFQGLEFQYKNETRFLEPLYLEFQRLGITDPLTPLKNLRRPEELFTTINVMRDNHYPDNEIGQVVGLFPLIEARGPTNHFASLFQTARQSGVSFEEIMWIVEESTHYSQRYLDTEASNILGAYIAHGVHSREAAHEVYQNIREIQAKCSTGVDESLRYYLALADHTAPAENRLHAVQYLCSRAGQTTLTVQYYLLDLIELVHVNPSRIDTNDLPRAIADKLDPRHCVSIVDKGDPFGMMSGVGNALALRLGIPEVAAGELLRTKSPKLWEFVFKYRAEAYIFDFAKFEEYKAIAKELHNNAATPGTFFHHLSFEYSERQYIPKSLTDAAKIYQSIEAISHELGSRYGSAVVAGRWERFPKDYLAWLNPKTHRLDVTRYNIKAANQLLSLFSHISADLRGFYPDIESEYKWFSMHLDVEEIDVPNLPRDTYLDYYELIKRLQDANVQASSRYLSGRMLELDVHKVFSSADVVDIAKVDEIRKKSNESYPHLGDRLVDNLGIAMLEKIEPSAATIAELLRIAKIWGLKGNGAVQGDDRGLYQQYSNFAYQMIGDAVLGATGDWRDADRIENLKIFLAGQKVDLEVLVTELEGAGFPIRTESDWNKFKNRITTDPGYVLRRGAQKVLPVALQANNMSGLKAVPATDWVLRAGVTVQVVTNENGKEIARALQCDRVVMGVEVLLNSHALVDTEKRKMALGTAYVFSAPLNMTTLDGRTMTEIAYQDGEPMNWLMSARGKDGLLLVSKDHSPRILDKRSIALSEMLDAKDVTALTDDLMVWKKRRKLESLLDDAVLSATIRPFSQLADKVLFRRIMEYKSYSLLSGMLFTTDSNAHRLAKEGTASRRLFVEYADGKFGVVDGTEYLTTEEAFEAAKVAGATKAIYMDTGFWDQADYVDGKGESHRLDPGHSNSSASTNRVIIRLK